MPYYNKYKETDRICDIICDEPALLQSMSRFGLPLGVGEKTVKQVCEERGVDTATFLVVADFIHNEARGAADSLERVSVKCLTDYLKQAHIYFLDFQLPSIRRKLLEALDCSQTEEVSFLILKFYDEYMGEVRKHMLHENRKVFVYVDHLLLGQRDAGYSISQFARSHSSIDAKLQELKNIIIKYYAPTEKTELLHAVLYDIFTCERDLRMHCRVEDDIFVPVVEMLEQRVAVEALTEPKEESEDEKTGAMLSERERDVVRLAVCGLSNKQIAAELFISINTVQTHRKNIARKLDIHSVAGLTIYAIVNKIVTIEELGKMQS